MGNSIRASPLHHFHSSISKCLDVVTQEWYQCTVISFGIHAGYAPEASVPQLMLCTYPSLGGCSKHALATFRLGLTPLKD